MPRDIQPDTIVDPAERLVDPNFGTQLLARYRDRQPGGPEGVRVTEEQYIDAYSNFCDVACQLLWPDKMGLTPDDPMSHTSDAARSIANILMVAAGFGEEVPEPQ